VEGALEFSCRRLIPSGLVGLMLIGSPPAVSILTADNPRDAFVKSWKGSRVLVEQVLYTLVYSERSPIGTPPRLRSSGRCRSRSRSPNALSLRI
jgi:hypothetical protein